MTSLSFSVTYFWSGMRTSFTKVCGGDRWQSWAAGRQGSNSAGPTTPQVDAQALFCAALGLALSLGLKRSQPCAPKGPQDSSYRRAGCKKYPRDPDVASQTQTTVVNKTLSLVHTGLTLAPALSPHCHWDTQARLWVVRWQGCLHCPFMRRIKTPGSRNPLPSIRGF